MRVVDVVARCLTEAGVELVFGVVGSGNFTVTASLQEQGARFVAARHENGAVCMADAYARVSGGLGVATVHQGPGLTNAMTGLTEAAKARTPLVVVAADTLGRLLFFPYEIPAGIWTILVVGPVAVWLARSRLRGGEALAR